MCGRGERAECESDWGTNPPAATTGRESLNPVKDSGTPRDLASFFSPQMSKLSHLVVYIKEISYHNRIARQGSLWLKRYKHTYWSQSQIFLARVAPPRVSESVVYPIVSYPSASLINVENLVAVGQTTRARFPVDNEA